MFYGMTYFGMVINLFCPTHKNLFEDFRGLKLEIFINNGNPDVRGVIKNDKCCNKRFW